MRLGFLRGLVSAIALVYVAPIIAHHSFMAVFDPEQPIELTGTITEIEWMNPHVWFYIDIESEGSATENWGFEMGSPNGLIRRGWNHKSLEVGQVVTVIGVLARDGSQRGAVRTVTLPTGESLFGAQNDSR